MLGLMLTESCVVADQFCEAPANLSERPRLKAVCFSCGETVCLKCSSLRKYYSFGKKRLCNNCQIEYDGNDKIVVKRMYKLAGY